jgi:RNA polymerase sigma-70 factor (ECF subfamily)
LLLVTALGGSSPLLSAGDAAPAWQLRDTAQSGYDQSKALIEKWQPDMLVVGLPVHGDGTPHEMTDEALLAACATGDGAALGALFDRHSEALYRFASRFAGISEADLDDLVSVTFLEACRSAKGFRGGSSVRTWLFGIAVNVARHHVRGDARRRAFLSAYQEVPVADEPGGVAENAARRRVVPAAKVERGSGHNGPLRHEVRVLVEASVEVEGVLVFEEGVLVGRERDAVHVVLTAAELGVPHSVLDGSS